MAKYRLRAQHVINGVPYGTGTLIGDGTGVPFAGEPSTDMEGLDDEGRNRVNEIHQRLYKRDAPWTETAPQPGPYNVDGEADDEVAPLANAPRPARDTEREPGFTQPPVGSTDISRGGGPEQPPPDTPTENRAPVKKPLSDLLPKVD